MIDTLPKHRPPPASFQEYKDRGVWDVLDGHTAERAAGVAFTHAVIHISGDLLMLGVSSDHDLIC